MLENLYLLLSHLNYLAILAAGAAAMVIAGIWYNPKVMGSAWMKENNFKEKDLTSPGPAMLQGFLANIILAFGLASSFAQLQMFGMEIGSIDGALWGFGFAVLIHGAAGYPNYVFEKRSAMLFLIHLSNSALGMAAMGAILAYWN